MKPAKNAEKSYHWQDDPPIITIYFNRAEMERHFFIPISRERASEYRKFYSLANRWKNERGPTSSITEMAIHPAYQEIIGMGKEAIPLILSELEKSPDHWFWALSAISGEDPVKPEDRGRIKKMAEVWLEWGREKGYR